MIHQHLRLPFFSIIFLTLLGLACSTDSGTHSTVETPERQAPTGTALRYLALGDSYTAGTGIDTLQSFPRQLQQNLATELVRAVTVEVIAQAGWRTDDLMDALAERDLEVSYDLVTLLIGVNNQFQNRPFSQYENEFPLLVGQALNLVDNNPRRVRIISIPDYFFTPFGQDLGFPMISEEIDNYNNFARSIATENDILFVDITDISREGLEDSSLVARDNLHLSEKAYGMFVDRIFPSAVIELKD